MDRITLLELSSIDSTNRYASSHFDRLTDGALVFAREQTAGRGRFGRSWVSPPDTNICATLVFKQPGEAFLAGAMCGLAILEMVNTAAPGLNPFLKWPNDVYVGSRKLAGILCESIAVADGKVTGLVAGMGININLSAAELAGIDLPATSLLTETGRKNDLGKLIEMLAESLLRYYIVHSESPDALFEEWKAANRLIGRRLEFVAGGGEVLSGVFASIARDGSLILDLGGKLRSFSSGEIRIRRESIQ